MRYTKLDMTAMFIAGAAVATWLWSMFMTLQGPMGCC